MPRPSPEAESRPEVGQHAAKAPGYAHPHDIFSESREDLRMMQRFLEAWGAQQEALLRNALEQMASICTGGGAAASAQACEAAVSVVEHNSSSQGEEVRAMLEAAMGQAMSTGEHAPKQLRDSTFRLVASHEDITEGGPADVVDPPTKADKGAAPPNSAGWRHIKTFSTDALPRARTFINNPPRSEWSNLRRRASCIVGSHGFEGVCGAMIVLNAATIAYSTDMAVQESVGGEVRHMDLVSALEAIFIGWYTVELSLRIFVYRLVFFLSADWAWNSLDVFLVALSFYDVALVAAGAPSGASNLSFMRLLKILKVLKTLRTVRVLRMFRELRLIIESVFGSIKSLVWAIVMIAMVTYIFGCCFAQAMALHLSALPAGATAERDEILFYWSTVLSSMNTLYMCSTSGESWRFPAIHLYNFSPLVYMLFLVYISFFLFVVVNTLTSIVMEAVMNHATKERAEIIAEELKRKHKYIKDFEDVYRQVDDDRSGDVTMEELSRHLQDDRMLAFMESLEIDASDVHQFFSSLSMDGSHTVDIETFVVGCMKLKGTARSLDLQCLANSHLNLVRDQRKFERKMSKQVEQVQTSLNAVLRALAAPIRRPG